MRHAVGVARRVHADHEGGVRQHRRPAAESVKRGRSLPGAQCTDGGEEDEPDEHGRGNDQPGRQPGAQRP